MDRWVIAFVAACLSSMLWVKLPSLHYLSVVAFLSLSLVKWPIARPLSGFLFGSLWMASVGHCLLSWQLPLTQIHAIERLEGKIIKVTNFSEHISFVVRAANISDESPWQQFLPSAKVKLAWHGATERLYEGQYVSLAVKLKPAYGLANEGGFHYQQWLRSQQINARGYVKSTGPNVIHPIKMSTRSRLKYKLDEMGLRYGGWVSALTIGDRSKFDAADWQVLQASGTAHLVAVSGLHLATLAGFAMLCGTLVFRVLAVFCAIPQFINLRLLMLILSGSLCCWYAWITGMAIPVMRAQIVVVLVVCLHGCRCYWRSDKIILYGVFLILLLFPLSMLSISFWLSVIAVVSLCFLLWTVEKAGGKQGSRAKWTGMVKIQATLWLVMLPMTAIGFAQVSLVAPVVNLIAIPVVTLVLLPLCLAGLALMVMNIAFAENIFHLTDALFALSISGLHWVTDGSFSVFSMAKPSTLSLLFLGATIVLFMLPVNKKIKAATLFMAVPFMSHFLPGRSLNWQIDVLDVGQGLSVLVSKGQHAILYDVGPATPYGFNMADNVILPLLRKKGIGRLDWVFISHFDNDHAGSLEYLQRGIKVNRVFSNRDNCLAGFSKVWQDLEVRALWPVQKTHAGGNHNSCVIKISDARHSVLLAGDIDRQAESQLVTNARESLHADVLVVPHHGSNTSSSAMFIEAVAPQLAVFSEGFYNRWQFPSQPVVNRYVKAGAALRAISETGQLTITFPVEKDQPFSLTSFRQHTYPYWYANLIGW